MIRLSACIEMVYSDLPFEDRIRKTAQMGIPAIEFWGWFGKDLAGIASVTKELGLPVAAVSLSGPGGPFSLLDGAGTQAFVERVAQTIEAIKPLGKPCIITTSGNELPGVSRAAQHDSLTQCIAAAAPILEKEGFTLVLEPLNPHVDHKGVYLAHSAEGFAIIDAVNSPNVKLLYDVYHQQITEGNLIDTIRNNIDKIGHIHTADVPGRNEPGTGEICYPNVLKAISQTGYAGYVGMEFRLTCAPEQALAHMLDAAAKA